MSDSHKSYIFFHCSGCNSFGKLEAVSAGVILTQPITNVDVFDEGGEVNYSFDDITIHDKDSTRYQCFYCGWTIPVTTDDELVEWMRENGMDRL